MRRPSEAEHASQATPYQAPTVLVSPPDGVPGIDQRRARRQWDRLVEVIDGLGGPVEVVAADPRYPLRTFVRDLAVPRGDGVVLVPSPRRRRRGDHLAIVDWFTDRGWRVVHGPPLTPIEGGDVIDVPGCAMLVGRSPTSSGAGARWLAGQVGGTPTVEIPLDATAGHLDLVLTDLGGRAWMMDPDGVANPASAAGVIESHLDQPVSMLGGRTDAEALELNLLKIGHVVIGAISERVATAVLGARLEPIRVELDAFLPARGGARCLTLPVPANINRRTPFGSPHDL